MIRCSRCNNLNPEGSIACNRCGQVLPSNNKAIQGQKQYQQMNIQNQVYGDGYVQQDFTQQSYANNDTQQNMGQQELNQQGLEQQNMNQQNYEYGSGVQENQTYAQNSQDYGNQSYTYGANSYNTGYNNQGYQYNNRRPKTGLIIAAVIAIVGLIFCCCIVGVIVKALKEGKTEDDSALGGSDVNIISDIEAPEDDFGGLDESLDNSDYSYDNSDDYNNDYSGSSSNLYVDYPDMDVILVDSVGVKINVNPFFIKYDGSTVEIPCDLTNTNENAVTVNVLDIRVDGSNSKVSNIDFKAELGSGTVIDGLPQSLFNVPIKATLNNVSSLENLHEIAIDFKFTSSTGNNAVIKDCKFINLDDPDNLGCEAGYVDFDLSSYDLDLTGDNKDGSSNDSSKDSEKPWGNVETKLYGSQDIGYVELPTNYVDFVDVDVPADQRGSMKQYTDGEFIITMNCIPNGDSHESIKNIAEALEAEGTQSRIQVDGRAVGDRNSDGSYPMELNSVMAEGKDGYIVLINCWYSDLTKSPNDMIYLAIESPTASKEAFTDAAMRILSTHTYGRFSMK